MRYNVEKVGLKIREERTKHNMSREELAEKLDISDSYLGLVERCTRGITINNLVKIADIFNVSIDSLLIDDYNNSYDKFSTLAPLIENFSKEQIDLSIKLLKDLSNYFNNENK